MSDEEDHGASFGGQLLSLIWRNFTLKKRKKKQTIQEIGYPVIFIALLGAIRITTSPSPLPPIHNFETVRLNQFKLVISSSSILVSPNSSSVQTFMEEVLDEVLMLNSSAQIRFFPTWEDSERFYVNATRNDSSVLYFGVHFYDASFENFTYSIRVPTETVASSASVYGNQGQCRLQSGLSPPITCPANGYLFSGFSLLQNALDTAFIRIKSGHQDYVLPNIYVQQLPLFSYIDITTLISFGAIYFVIAYAPFVNFLTVSLVAEKETKIKESMRMMGMRDSAFWISWAVVYAAIIAIVSVLAILIAWGTRLFQYSNLFILFLLLFLYGLSTITMAFLVTPFFNKAEVAGSLTSLVTLLFSLLYLAISFTTTNTPKGPVSSIHVIGQYFLALISPLAFALGIGQGLYLDLIGTGMTFSNMKVGQFPISSALIMLSVDFVLYGLLAVYFDNVIPGEYGQRQSALFCFMPSYWRSKKTTAQKRTRTVHEPNRSSEDMEPVESQLVDKNVLRIHEIKKIFKSNSKSVTAVNGVSLDIYEGQITCLLGHNGAGKTSLINILTGMTPATSGEASIYGHNVSDPTEMSAIRKMTGVCPQHNILFDELTCREHIRFVAGVKGLSFDKVAQQADKVLKEVQLDEVASTFAKDLSGGQKRKLCLAMALVGEPRVLFLDEPTSGMDPYSRRSVWALLKKKKAGCVILLTTHFMDEADILADRKAFLTKGRLRCVGSSLFLKNRFGVGYHLGLVVDSLNKSEEITALIHKHVPNAKLARAHGKELSYTLPLDSVNRFPGLFESIEEGLEDNDHDYRTSDGADENNVPEHATGAPSAGHIYGIRSYGVSMTTLEEVFFKIGDAEDVEEDADVEDNQHDVGNDGPLIQQQTIPPINPNSRNSTDESIHDKEFGDLLTGSQLHSQRFWAMLRLRYLLVRRSKLVIFYRIIYPILMIIGGGIALKFIPQGVNVIADDPRLLTASLYSRVSGVTESRDNPNMTFSHSTSADQNASDFFDGIRKQGILQTEIKRDANFSNIAPHMMGTVAERMDAVGLEIQSSIVKILYNITAVHSIPTTLNVISNSLMLMSLGPHSISNSTINTYSWPWPTLRPNFAVYLRGVFTGVMLFGMALTMIPPGFGIGVVKDREIKARSQLRISGLTFELYWGSIFLIDFIQYALACLASLVVLFALRLAGFLYAGAIITLMLVYILYMPLLILCVYCLSFAFTKYQTAQSVLPISFFLISLMPYLLVSILEMARFSQPAKALHYAFTVISPPYGVYGALYYIGQVYVTELLLQLTVYPTIPISTYFQWNSNIIITLIVPPFQMVVFFFLLRYLDIRSTGGDTRDTLPCASGGDLTSSLPDNVDIIDGEDDDVQNERDRVTEVISGQRYSQYPVLVSGLRKEFTKSGRSYNLHTHEHKVNVAVRNNSFVVEAGEVYGLLGPNGAGKTTTLNMIMSEEIPTCGKVFVGGHDARSSMSEAFQALGYCAQHDPQWDLITLREHIECYAAVRGIPKHLCPGIATYFIHSLQVEEHESKNSKKLSGGTKRKLSYAISMLGEPHVVLLDEPSTGMDPKSKRFMWDTISKAFADTHKGAILTTHSMEEADALCSRVGIMVNGQLKCIGSTQHLKNKFGSGYILEIKLQGNHRDPVSTEEVDIHVDTSAESEMDCLRRFISRLFPHAVEIECFEERATYKIPKEDVGVKVSKTFAALEDANQQMRIEEYSFSQCTLEQVFLEFVKGQLEGNQDDAISIGVSQTLHPSHSA